MYEPRAREIRLVQAAVRAGVNIDHPVVRWRVADSAVFVRAMS